ncbi:MBL fold metallo-hydrolase [Fundidesulfovibrio agrisoli]|uniref:MBL fold metallo-hydrolase n=1 Tax=Fundidesulfovibrio agrisoli TaxID=2922717 RepID=UPI001FAB7777|nr:MBL fold metallo-hydrolase [Fundidesulfovibrio agrisoli]
MCKVYLTVHRAASEIGGNCIEIATSRGERLILDVGKPLEGLLDCEVSLPGTLDLSTQVSGVLLTHAHQDHYGLLQSLPDDWPIYCGRATAKLIKLGFEIIHGPIERTFSTWQTSKPFDVGPFKVTPFLTDHSAFDAYMLLVEVDGKRILYSGDFRMHGRKAALVERLIRKPPSDINALVMEGTNLGREKVCKSEAELEEEFVQLFKRTSGRAFIAWSGQNVDRTVTLYRACLKAGRTLVVDIYTAEVLELLSEYGRIPQPGWPSLKVVVTKTLSSFYRHKGREQVTERMAKKGISAKKLAATPEKWVVMTRSSLIKDYIAAGVTPDSNDIWSWSMWPGYLNKPHGQEVKNWFEINKITSTHIHTSGHATPATLSEIARSINAKVLILVHGDAWKNEMKDMPPVTQVTNGVPFVI